MTAIVRTSARLRLAHGGLCCCVMASAAACPGWIAPLACVLAGLLGWWCGWLPRKTCALDISGVGQLRLTVYQEVGATQQLLDGSTLWPRLLLLRLGDGDGHVQPLLVLADSVSRDELRSLSLACRAIAARVQIKTPAL